MICRFLSILISMISTVTASSNAELDVSSSSWPVDFSPVVLRTAEGDGATDATDLAPLWTSRAEVEQSGPAVKLSPDSCGP